MNKCASPNNSRTKKQTMVANCHGQSNSIGISILKSGGNAIDAFVATTFADYVVAPGTTSMAGALYAMVYEPTTQEIINLSAGFKTPSTEDSNWQNDQDAIGKKVLIPGAISGLAELHKKYGRLPWGRLLDPAIYLAETGFPISDIFSFLLKNRRNLLFQSEYARSLFFRDNDLFKAGDILRQPHLSKTLSEIKNEGDTYFYQGKWACDLVKTIHLLGGKLTLNDLKNYKPIWNEPLNNSYREYEIFAPGGRSFGGIKIMLAMKILERINIKELGHWTENATALEIMIRIARLIENEYWFFDPNKLDDHQFISDQLSDNKISQRFDKIKPSMEKNTTKSFLNHHSAQTIIVDNDGRVITGMHTISSLPWGDAIFVGGVPLNSSGDLSLDLAPNQYVPDASTLELVKKDKKIILASGFFSSSMFPADYQVLSNMLDFGMNPKQALLTPRFGIYKLDPTTWVPTYDNTKAMLDPRYSTHIISELQTRGIDVTTEGYIDTGMGVLVSIECNGCLIQGMTPEQLEVAAITC